VIDLAEAHILGMEALLRGKSGTFNLGNGSGYSVKEVVSVASEIVGVEIPNRVVGRRMGDPARLVASSERAKKELGWAPAHTSLSGIVESAWNWMRAFPSGYAD
jgi:UDP-glucose 4-epimerase